LCACLSGLRPLTCCFSLKLLNVYEIGMKSNLKFGFCSYTSLFNCYVMLRSEQLLPNLLIKWKLSSVKLICKHTQLTLINCYNAPLFLSSVDVNGAPTNHHHHHHHHHILLTRKYACEMDVKLYWNVNGLTENAGRENDGPICRTWNCKTWKCRTWTWRTKMTAGREISGETVQF